MWWKRWRYVKMLWKNMTLCRDVVIIHHHMYIYITWYYLAYLSRDVVIFRHSRLPAGNALWFCQNFFIIFFLLFFRRQGFRMIIFDRQAGPLQNFNRSHIMVIGRSVSFSDPARPPGGGVGRPKIPPPPKNIFFCMRFRTPGTFLTKQF